MLFSPWPQSIFAFVSIWAGLTSRFQVLAIDLLDLLEAGHCVWEERAPEFESIVAQWVSGGFRT